MIDVDGPLLVVAAHADDEVLGAGGTIATARRLGREVHVVVLSTSVESRGLDRETAQRVRASRRQDALDAAALLGVGVETHDLPDNGFDTLAHREVNAIVEAAVRRHAPTTVLTHSPAEVSLDHQVTSRATMVACRPVDGATAPTVLMYEIRSSTDWVTPAEGAAFAPNVFVRLDDDAWEAKLRALDVYASELRDAPHARSLDGIDALARFRGTQVGVARAEAFVLARAVLTP